MTCRSRRSCPTVRSRRRTRSNSSRPAPTKHHRHDQHDQHHPPGISPREVPGGPLSLHSMQRTCTMAADTEVHPVVEMRGITIEFPGVKALANVDFVLRAGEVHALMGENGAGKSTLIKALTGVYPVDAGRITLDGAGVEFSGPAQAQAAGISTVYQEVDLCPNLTVAENLLLGREPRKWGRIDGRAVRRRAREVLARLHLDIDPSSPLGSHPIAVQQLVSIARAVQVDAKVLVL